MMGIQRCFDAVHHLPFRPRSAKNIVMLLELNRRLFHDNMAAQLIGKFA